MVRSSTEVDNQASDDEANDSDDLQTGEPEFEFAEVLDTSHVNQNHADEQHGDV